MYKFTSTIWLYTAETAAWHFATVPKKESDLIKSLFGKKSKGWGSLPVEVTIGKTRWQTSIFRDSKIRAYILPIKALVRKQEKIREGDRVQIIFKIRTDK